MSLYWGGHFPDAANGGGGGGGSIVFPVLANATTAEAIRDRIIAVITTLTPRALVKDRFKKYLNEGDADFKTWARSKPESSFRRFQVRENITGDARPSISNTDFERRMVTFLTMVAYPQTNRTGKDAALDRDDVLTLDRHQIDVAIGMDGRQNFAPPFPDAVCVETLAPAYERVGGVDILIMTHTFLFNRTMT